MLRTGSVLIIALLLVFISVIPSSALYPIEDIKSKSYSEEYLESMITHIQKTTQSEFGLSTEDFFDKISSDVVRESILVHTPSIDKIDDIVKNTIEDLRAKYSLENSYFDMKKLNVLIALIIFMWCIGYYTFKAARGEKLYIRKISGLQSIDEAVGRCTEMGKPVLFVPGIYDLDDIQTISAISILGHIAKTTAEYETPLLVPCTRSLVMSTAFEVCKESYIQAGKADMFVPENVRYLTDDQFGYVAGVDGIMLRDEPAANFYLGVFFAESLILAETGHSIGSIQIAGTAMVHQIPFFVAACDYTLIGEELFAASAYLSKDPMQLGSIKGQDMSKFIMIIILLTGIVVASLGSEYEAIVRHILEAK